MWENKILHWIKGSRYNNSFCEESWIQLLLLPASWRSYTWVLYILIVIFIITAVSNGSNLTDGLDGLATGTSAIIVSLLGIFAYASGNLVLPIISTSCTCLDWVKLSIFICGTDRGLSVFLWYNSYPAQIFMGDTGSLMLSGVIAALAICTQNCAADFLGYSLWKH